MRRSLLAALAFVAGGLALSAIDRAWFRDRDRMPAAAPVPDPGGRVSRDDWQALLDGQRAMDARLTLLAPQPPAPAVDLKPLEQRLQAVSERVEGFGKQLEPVASLSVKVGGINDHLGAMDASLERLRNAIPRQMVARA